jgi:hypothetical protein
VSEGQGPGTGPDLRKKPEPVELPQPSNTRFFGVYSVSPERYGRDLTRLSQEIFQHLAGEGVDLEIKVEVSARRSDGFGDDKVRIVTENARTLKFDQFGFEDD